ncbi:hypothetical protein GG344DRAFT_75496 [Lentinula edodes]|nr:hypothetical protein GG344DRAFT_75496 [Lentinula edodes]
MEDRTAATTLSSAKTFTQSTYIPSTPFCLFPSPSAAPIATDRYASNASFTASLSSCSARCPSSPSNQPEIRGWVIEREHKTKVVQARHFTVHTFIWALSLALPRSKHKVSPSTFHPQTPASPAELIFLSIDMENPDLSVQMPGTFPEPVFVFVSLSMCSEDISNDVKQLLEQLKALDMKQGNLQEIVADVYRMGAQILLHNEEKHDRFDDGGVAVQTFIPFTTSIIHQTILCVKSHLKKLENQGTQETKSSNSKKFLRKPILRRLIPRKLTVTKKTNDNVHNLLTINLMELHKQMRVIHFIAMPYDKPSTHSEKIDDILAVSANIGSVLTIVFDGVPVLGMLKPAACALSGICTAVQTFRSNKNVAAEILYTVRDDIRWVIHKIQKDYTSRMVYTTEGPWELGEDVNEYFQNLQEIIFQTYAKQKRTRKSIPFAHTDRDDLNLIFDQMRDARNRFQAKLVLSTHGTNQAILDMTGGIVTQLDHNAVKLQHVNNQLLSLIEARRCGRFFFCVEMGLN